MIIPNAVENCFFDRDIVFVKVDLKRKFDSIVRILPSQRQLSR